MTPAQRRECNVNAEVGGVALLFDQVLEELLDAFISPDARPAFRAESWAIFETHLPKLREDAERRLYPDRGCNGRPACEIVDLATVRRSRGEGRG